MTLTAQGHEVVKAAGLFWVIEQVIGNDVMYIQLVAPFLFGNTTALASITVSFSGPSALALPVAATIVKRIATLPTRRIFTSQIF